MTSSQGFCYCCCTVHAIFIIHRTLTWYMGVCDHLAYTDRFVKSSEGLFQTASAQNLTPEKKFGAGRQSLALYVTGHSSLSAAVIARTIVLSRKGALVFNAQYQLTISSALCPKRMNILKDIYMCVCVCVCVCVCQCPVPASYFSIFLIPPPPPPP